MTLLAHDYDEAMHSLSGAFEESLLKHVRPSGLPGLRKSNLRVLDIGFGLGYNCLATLFELLPLADGRTVEIVSLEKDLSAIPFMKSLCFNDSRDELYASIILAAEYGSIASERFCITVIRGDARLTIQHLPEKHFDAVFHDAFSPPKNPEMWSVEFFNEISRVISPTGILTTYSSARHIRRALLESGFRIGRGPSVGKKREGTLASIAGNIPLIPESDSAMLRENRSAAPYRDFGLCNSRKEILEMKQRVADGLRPDHRARG